MFGFGKKQEDDPKKAIEKAWGLGFFTRLFIGKKSVDEMVDSMYKMETMQVPDIKMDDVETHDELANTGRSATAEVLSIEDTGMMINYNPVVRMKLNVTPESGSEFKTNVKTVVSKIAIPRVGDKIKIKYNPENRNEILVL